MDYNFLCILGLEFIVAFLVDIAIHKQLKIHRRNIGKVLLLVLLIGAFLSTYIGIIGYQNKENSEASTTYLAYRYLMDSELNSLDTILRSGKMDKEQEELVSLISRYKRGDFYYVYMNTQENIDNSDLNSSLIEYMLALNKLSSNYITVAVKSDGADDNEAKFKYKNVNDLIVDCFESLSFAENYLDEYDMLYELDKAVTTKQGDYLSEDKLQEIVEKYSNNKEVLRTLCKYNMQADRSEDALKYAEKLIDLDNSIESYIVYTDIIAQNQLSGSSISYNEDHEVKELLEKSKELWNKVYRENTDEKKINRFVAEANNLDKKAREINIRRSINYLLSRKPLIRDVTGLYDIQLAKLYLAIDEREKSREYINRVVENYNQIVETSAVKNALANVVEAYKQSEGDDVSPHLASAVEELIKIQSQGVVETSGQTVNQRFSDYMTSTLKYNKTSMFISKIDASEYPNVKAYVNISGKKEKLFGLLNDFNESDFKLVDTQYEITDFEIIDKQKNERVDLALVLDSSGSMDGFPINDLKVAATTCIEKMDTWNSKIAVIEYNTTSNTIVSATNSKHKLINGINSIKSGGGTNIASGLKSGVSELKNSDSNRVIILMSDGRDTDSFEDIEKVIQEAISNNIIIFAVGLGDVDTDYLGQITSATGGRYIHANDSIDLENVYVLLQKYIVNNYCFSYQVTKNEEVDPRKLMITLKDYQKMTDEKYNINLDDTIAQKMETGTKKIESGTFSIIGVQPRNVSLSDVHKGTELTISGIGFEKNMNLSIGEYSLTNVEFVDSTTVKGKLTAPIISGQYAVKAELNDGKTDLKTQAINVFRAGTTTKVRLGSLLISADTIGQIDEDSFIASGNVMVNNFLHIENSLNIKAYNLPSNYEIKPQGITDIGGSGSLYGDGKVFVSYSQAVSNGKTSNKFANLVLNGKDYVVSEGLYRFNVEKDKTDFNIDINGISFKIPFMAELEISDIKLYPDRLQLNVAEVNPLEIIKSVKAVVSDEKSTTTKEKEAVDETLKVEKRNESYNFKGKDTKASASVALTADDVEFGFEVKLNTNNSIQFGKFGLEEAVLKLNSLDNDHEYWKVGGAFNFDKITKTLSGLDGYIASYYWCPDEIAVNAKLTRGIPIYNILFIDELGGKIDGMSTLFLNSPRISENVRDVLFPDVSGEVKRKDLILTGFTHAGVNLFKSFNMDIPEDMSKWGDLGEIDNGEIALNITRFNVKATADLKIMEEKLANSSIEFGEDGLQLKAKADTEISFFDIYIAGDIGFEVGTSWELLNVALETNGSVDSGWLNYHSKENSRVVFVGEYDGSYYCIELSDTKSKIKCWYDNDGNPVIWDKFHIETITL